MDKITLKNIENDREITRELDPEFMCEFQKAILLALLEDGMLTEQQYRSVERKLQI